MNTIEEWKKDFKGFINCLSMPRDDYNSIMKCIDEVPDGRPQGEWKYTHDTFSKRICNKCNYSQVIVDGMADNFCPNCGADMRKGDANNNGRIE